MKTTTKSCQGRLGTTTGYTFNWYETVFRRDCYVGETALAAVVSVSRIIPDITLRDDGSVCVNGFTCPDSGGGGNMCLADLNDDNIVATDDLLMLLASFGRACP
jgi:hypothetical protein